MCVEFYLILRAAGATKKLMWTLIAASTVMLVTGYFGEAVIKICCFWGGISELHIFILSINLFGEAKSLATSAGGTY